MVENSFPFSISRNFVRFSCSFWCTARHDPGSRGLSFARVPTMPKANGSMPQSRATCKNECRGKIDTWRNRLHK